VTSDYQACPFVASELERETEKTLSAESRLIIPGKEWSKAEPEQGSETKLITLHSHKSDPSLIESSASELPLTASPVFINGNRFLLLVDMKQEAMWAHKRFPKAQGVIP